MHHLPETGYLREKDILGRREITVEEAEENRRIAAEAQAAGKHVIYRPLNPRPAIPAIIPVAKSTWWKGINEGRYPKPVQLAANVTAWKVEDIRALVERMETSPESMAKSSQRMREVRAGITSEQNA